MITNPKTLQRELDRLEAAQMKLCGLERPRQISGDEFGMLYRELDAAIEALRWVKNHKAKPSEILLAHAHGDVQAVAGLIERRSA